MVLKMSIFQCFIESVEKISHVETSIVKQSDEIQFLDDVIHAQVLNNPEIEKKIETEKFEHNTLKKDFVKNYRRRFFYFTVMFF